MKRETRTIELRAAMGDEMALVGRALSYNSISSNELAPGIRERLMPGCFTRSLQSGRDVVCLYNHQSSGAALPLGRLANRTLEIDDDDESLDFRVKLDPNNSQHRDIHAAVKRGDLREMSFAFGCDDEDCTEDDYRGQKVMVRNIKRAELYDVSVVVQPFYGDGATGVDARNAGVPTTEQLRARLEKVTAAMDSERRATAARLAKTL